MDNILGPGADDHLAKPFFIAELLARAGAQPRRSNKYHSQKSSARHEIDLSQWSEYGKYELPFSRGESLQVDVLCDGGDVSLAISATGSIIIMNPGRHHPPPKQNKHPAS